MLTKKTWSRETAYALGLILIWTIYKENTALVEVIIWPILSYAALAFGLKRVDDSTKLFSDKPTKTSERWGR